MNVSLPLTILALCSFAPTPRATSPQAWEEAASAQLAALARIAEEGVSSADALAPLVAPELAFDALAFELPADAPLTLRVDDRAGDAPAARGVAAFAQELARWSSCFGGELAIELELERAWNESGAPTTLHRVRARGEPDGARLQQSARWRCTWTPSDDARAPLLSELRVEQADLLRAEPGAPRFVERGPAAFDADGVYHRQLLPGLTWWQERVDANLGITFLGHQGLALGDVDGDGLEDLYVCQPGGLPNLLFLRQPDGATREVGAAAGVDFLDPTACALLVDLDGDGDRDLAALVGDELLFLANDGEGRFEKRGLFDAPATMSMCAADVDADGDLDLYLCGYVSPYSNESTPVPYHVAENGAPNRLLLNLGNLRFRNATAALGLDENNRRFSFAAAFEDYDDDGDPDLYVSNDFGRNNLYRNEGGRFRDVADEAGVLDVAAGMGVSWGDYDRDGRMDLYVSNMHSAAGGLMTMGPMFQAEAGAEERGWFQRHARGNSLYRNLGGGRFEDLSVAQGVNEGGWAWGAIFTEYDNDGRLDVFVPNGMATNELEQDLEAPFWAQVIASSPTGGDEDFEAARAEYISAWRRINSAMRQGWSWHGSEPDAAFVQGDGRFLDAAWAFGLDLPEDGRAAARVDWDHDGDLDLLVTSRTSPRLRLLVNELAPGDDYVALRLRGSGGNTDAIGARVELVLRGGPGGRSVASARAGEGFLAQQSGWLHFGLGGGAPEQALVRWPDGAEERFDGIARGGFYVLAQGSGRAERWTPPASAPALVERRVAPPPDAGARVIPAWPIPAPSIAVEEPGGAPRVLLGVTPQGQERAERPLVVALCDPRELETATWLAMLGSKRGDFERAGLELLALCAGGDDARAEQTAALERLMWNGRAAFIGAEARAVLDVLHGALIDRETPLPLPSALVFDSRAQLVAVHAGASSPDALLADRLLIDPELDSEARRRLASPFTGIWNAPVIAAPLGYYQARFEARGLPQAAREYMFGRIEVVQVSPAEAAVQRGRALAREKRYAEAEAAFREAIAADDTSFDAHSGLAIVLHSTRRFAEARSSYARALQLDPKDADTWFNLGLVSLALKDRASAVKIAERLAELDPQLVAQLERAIAAFDGR